MHEVRDGIAEEDGVVRTYLPHRETRSVVIDFHRTAVDG
jgi:hypothetical protein